MLVGLKEVWKMEHRSLVSEERREGGMNAAIDMLGKGLRRSCFFFLFFLFFCRYG